MRLLPRRTPASPSIRPSRTKPSGKSAAGDNAPKQVSGLTGKVFNHPLGSGRTRVAGAAAETLRFGPRIASDDVKLVRVDDDLELRIEGIVYKKAMSSF